MKTILFILILIILGCNKEIDNTQFDTTQSDKPTIIGIWNLECQEGENFICEELDDTLTYYKENNFQQRKYGFQFFDNNTLKVRTVNGFCGTFPHQLSYCFGSYLWLNDSVIELKYDRWEGEKIDSLMLIKLTHDSLLIVK